MVTIPANYWKGEQSLELEYPWLTPGAIDFLDGFLKSDMTVLECGAGGSTLFFARRCKSVITLESEQEWVSAAQNMISKKGVTNVELCLTPKPSDFIAKLAQIPFCDVVLVDCYPNAIPRPLAVRETFLKAKCLFILDNYLAFGCEQLKRVELYAGCQREVFDDLHWLGQGTEIITKE